MLRDVGGGREAELLHPLEEALVAVAARHPQEVPRCLRQLEDVADVDDVTQLEVELGGEAARQRLLLDDLGEADLVAAEVVVLVEEPRRQLVVDQRAARKEPGRGCKLKCLLGMYPKGPCTYDVRKILGILDPPPPCPHFTQPISTVHLQN